MDAQATAERICDALLALLARGRKDSCVLIEEPQSRRYVQFGPGQLAIDLPLAALTADEADRAYQLFRELGDGTAQQYEAPDVETGRTNYGATLRHDFGADVQAAARAAAAIFVEVYRLPADSKLTVCANWRTNG
jgi:hypothetical protein